MPFETKWEDHGFYTKFWGVVPHSEIEAKNNVFSGDPRCDSCRYKIFDATEVEAFVFSEKDITSYASNDIGMATYLKNLSVVLVGSKAEVRRAFQCYTSTCLRVNMTWKFHLCDTLEQAREWLSKQEKRRSVKFPFGGESLEFEQTSNSGMKDNLTR